MKLNSLSNVFLESQLSVKDIQEVDSEALNDVEFIITEARKNDTFSGLHSEDFLGICLIKIYGGVISAINSTTPIKLTNEDEEKILKFFVEDEIESYMGRYFRIDLANYILMFSVNRIKDCILLIGNVLKNTREMKLELLMQRQRFLRAGITDGV